MLRGYEKKTENGDLLCWLIELIFLCTTFIPYMHGLVHEIEGNPFWKEKGGPEKNRQKLVRPPFSSPTGSPLKLPFPSPHLFPPARFYSASTCV